MRGKLKNIRLENEYTQQQIANALEISRAFYTKIELGVSNPSLKLAMKIKKVLNYPYDDIFLNIKCQKDTLSEIA